MGKNNQNKHNRNIPTHPHPRDLPVRGTNELGMDAPKGVNVTDNPKFQVLDQRKPWSTVVERPQKDGKQTITVKTYVESSAEFEVLANFLPVELNDKMTLYHYEVTGIPDNITKQKKKKLMRSMIETCDVLQANQDRFATDGQKEIVSWKPLDLNGQEPQDWEEIVVDVSYFDPREPQADQGNNPTISLKLQFNRQLPLADLERYFRGYNPDVDVNKLNFAITMMVSKELQKCSSDRTMLASTSKIYSRNGHNDLGIDHKSAIRGYTFGFQPRMGAGLLQVTPIMSAFHQPMTVKDYVKQGETKEQDWDVEHRKKQLEDDKIRVRLNIDRAAAYDNRDETWDGMEELDSETRRLKTITGFGPAAAKAQYAYSTWDDEGMEQQHTVWEHMEYYFGTARIHRGIKTQGSGDSLLVNLGGTEKGQEQWYLADDLTILPYQMYRGEMTPEMTSRMIREACRSPAKNLSFIVNEFMPLLGLDNHRQIHLNRLGTQGYKISAQIVAPPAHSAATATVRYADERKITATANDTSGPAKLEPVPTHPVYGVWDLVDQKFLSTTNKFQGNVHFLLPKALGANDNKFRDIERYMGHFFQEVDRNGVKGLQCSGMTWENCSIVEHFDVRTLADMLTHAKDKKKAGLAILILPRKDKTQLANYAAFKAAADQIVGMPSLCICDDKAKKSYGRNVWSVPNDINHSFAGYVRNIAMKLNVRLGNTNHSVLQESLEEAIPGFGDDKRFMILGADVVHPSPGAQKNDKTQQQQQIPSITAVVGSIDRDFAAFRGSARRQRGGKEIVEIVDMKAMVKERLQAYKAANGEYPNRILYYRDGIDKGQYNPVRQEEVRAIRNAWESVNKLADGTSTLEQLKITAVVVSKRHHTRLYPKDDHKAIPHNGNLEPGTVVDSSITMPYMFDFFLISHKSPQGTARPAHYIVLENQIGFTPKQIQDLTYLLCYTYARSTTSVSYVPAAYYADHLCERAKQYLRPIFDKTRTNESENAMWNRGKNGGNPWHANMNDTMFWM